MSCVNSSVSSLVVGDYIGMESCVDLAPSYSGFDVLRVVPEREADAPPTLRPPPKAVKRRIFPPPIPSLAQTENQPPHMAWVMRRYYSGDGRLVIREERVRHHDYFTADRSNGRLTLRLVLLDDGDPDSASDGRGEVEYCGNLDGGGREGGGDSPVVAKLAATETQFPSAEMGAGTAKCSEYDGMGSSACSFSMPVMALRPVLG